MPLAHYMQNILQLLTRHSTALWRLAFIVVISFFLAKTINSLVAYYVLPLQVSTKLAVVRSPDLTASRTVNISGILSRNIFDSEARKRVNNSGPIDSNNLHPSTLSVELLGTIVFKASRYSMALIRDRGTNRSEYYGVGDRVLTAVIQKIERFRVILEQGGRLEVLELKAAESKIAGSNPFHTVPSTPRTSQPGGDFEEIGPNRFAIPQTDVDDALNNFSKILTQARMVPNLTDDNRTDGFKVFQIKDGSIYQRLGMKDNDIIKRVNGQDLDSFEKATGLFSALRNEKTISIDIVRNGTRLNYTYEIR